MFHVQLHVHILLSRWCFRLEITQRIRFDKLLLVIHRDYHRYILRKSDVTACRRERGTNDWLADRTGQPIRIQVRDFWWIVLRAYLKGKDKSYYQLIFKADMKCYTPLETAAIFFLANLFLKQGISSENVMVDFICMGNLGLQGAKTKN